MPPYKESLSHTHTHTNTEMVTASQKDVANISIVSLAMADRKYISEAHGELPSSLNRV